MRAAEGDTVDLELTSTDRGDGAYYLEKSFEYEPSATEKDHVLADFSAGNKGINSASDNYIVNSMSAFVENFIGFRKNTYLAKNAWTDAVVTLYDDNGLYVNSWEVSRGAADDLTSLYLTEVSDGYTIHVELIVDNQTAGELYTSAGRNGDDIDDRDQALITVLMARNPYSTDYRSNSPTYVVNKGENVQALIEEGTYANFPGYDDADSEWYDRNKDVEYIRVYDNALTKVTEDVKIHGDWAENKAGLDRFAPAATNDKDTNGDGKVSCDEYYGTTGLVWSDEKNACVVESNGAVVVTIPNTATK